MAGISDSISLMTTADTPSTAKVTIEVKKQLDRNRVQVVIRTPLNPSVSAEQAALKRFSTKEDPLLETSYEVNIDLRARREQLTSAFSAVYRNENLRDVVAGQRLVKLDDVALRRLLLEPAKVGVSVLHDLFLSTDIKYEVSQGDQETIRSAVKSVLSRPNAISINSDEPLFPWGLLYDDVSFSENNPGDLDPQRFWGFKHELQQKLRGLTSRLNLHSPPKVLVAADDGLYDSTAGPAFASSVADMTEATSTAAIGQALGRFDKDCFYFFGHAFHGDPPSKSGSYLELGPARLSADELNRLYNAPQFSSDPVLAFVNGCETAPLTVWNEETIVGHLCHHGDNKLCCVATVAEVPPDFALEFGKEFSIAFFDEGKRIGQALLIARENMLKKWNNPLGLLYTLFGPTDLRLASAAGANA